MGVEGEGGRSLSEIVRLSAVLSSSVVRDSLLFVYILASHAADVWRGGWWASREESVGGKKSK